MQKKSVIKVVTGVLRWGIAVVGIWWVLSQISWHDQVLAIFGGSKVPQRVNLAETDASDKQKLYKVFEPVTGSIVTLTRDDVVNEPDKPKMKLKVGDDTLYLLAVDLDENHQATRLLVSDSPEGKNVRWITPAEAPDYHVTIPHPRVQVGVIRMVHQADTWFLLGAILVIPLTFIITSYRWHELLRALDVQISLARAFVLNMVGLFFNTFMPGTTGGDLLKAYYVAKQTHHGTRAAMSVLVDRVIGLLALIILGGVMAAWQWHNPMCRHVAIGAATIIAGVIACLLVFFVPLLHRISGLEFIISKLPWQKTVHKIVETLRILGRRPFLVAGAVLISFPVHMAVIVSAMLAGMAFRLPILPSYYWMAVPVIVLASAIPISPQGAGVMEYFAVRLLEPQGVTVAQAFALTMSIRLVQMLWNLSGGFFVLRGGYHAPTASEQHELEGEDQDEPPAAVPILAK